MACKYHKKDLFHYLILWIIRDIMYVWELKQPQPLKYVLKYDASAHLGQYFLFLFKNIFLNDLLNQILKDIYHHHLQESKLLKIS